MCLLANALSLKIGAFNVQVFGQAKAANQDIMTTLAKISARYDILLIQEIRDSQGDAIDKLQKMIKDKHGVTMTMVISDRLGRTTSKEQYAFLYRKDRGISVLDSYHFDDGDEKTGKDLFEREPFIVRFSTPNTALTDVTFVPLHAAPQQAVAELSNLTKVVDNIQRRWRTKNILILGDLNAACAYVPKKHWPSIAVRQDTRFWWPIADTVDTTVSPNTKCAYDRFIVVDDQLKQAIKSNSAKVFNFKQEYKLSDEQAEAVSDHYPIELEMSSAPAAPAATSHSRRIIAALGEMWQGFVNTFSRQQSPNSEL